MRQSPPGESRAGNVFRRGEVWKCVDNERRVCKNVRVEGSRPRALFETKSPCSSRLQGLFDLRFRIYDLRLNSRCAYPVCIRKSPKNGAFSFGSAARFWFYRLILEKLADGRSVMGVNSRRKGWGRTIRD